MTVRRPIEGTKTTAAASIPPGRLLLAAVSASAAACAAAGMLPWRESGVGAATSLVSLGQSVLSGVYAPIVPAWLGLAAFLPWAVGCAMLLGLALRRRRARLAVWVPAAVVSGALAAVALVGHGGLSSGVGPGAWAMVLAACAWLVVCAVTLTEVFLERRAPAVDPPGLPKSVEARR